MSLIHGKQREGVREGLLLFKVTLAAMNAAHEERFWEWE